MAIRAKDAANTSAYAARASDHQDFDVARHKGIDILLIRLRCEAWFIGPRVEG